MQDPLQRRWHVLVEDYDALWVPPVNPCDELRAILADANTPERNEYSLSSAEHEEMLLRGLGVPREFLAARSSAPFSFSISTDYQALTEQTRRYMQALVDAQTDAALRRMTPIRITAEPISIRDWHVVEIPPYIPDEPERE